jgi:hypothetical protein
MHEGKHLDCELSKLCYSMYKSGIYSIVKRLLQAEQLRFSFGEIAILYLYLNIN